MAGRQVLEGIHVLKLVLIVLRCWTTCRSSCESCLAICGSPHPHTKVHLTSYSHLPVPLILADEQDPHFVAETMPQRKWFTENPFSGSGNFLSTFLLSSTVSQRLLSHHSMHTSLHGAQTSRILGWFGAKKNAILTFILKVSFLCVSLGSVLFLHPVFALHPLSLQ